MALTSRPLGLTSTAISGGQYYFNFAPLEATIDRKKEEEALPPGPTQWRECDYLDRAEMYKLMQDGKEWDYSQCVWLMNQYEHDDAFPGGWEYWHTYAVTHCARFKKTQSR